VIRPQPGQPGKPAQGMPPRPKPIDPGHRIDPKHNGDGHSVQPPSERNGSHLPQKPLQNDHGRTLAPGHDHIGQFDRPDVRKNLHGVQDHWNRNDHGYDWHNWNGMNVCHHYDQFGYHWWGFYVGEVYFWTRFYNDGYWWYDPYWHRWVFLRDNQWWWQNPDNNVIYLYTDNGYYQYDNTPSGVVMTPDPTPAETTPPDPTPAPANQTTVYSADGTRSIQITGDNRDAYLYDLTATDPASAAAQARFIGTQVAGVKFDYVTANGITTKAIQQIELSYDDPSALSTVDINGQRRVDVSGDAQTASLINLADNTVDPVTLASGVSATALSYQTITDDSGNSSLSLQSITLTTTDGQGNQTSLTFDQDGNSLNGSLNNAPQSGFTPTPGTDAAKTLDDKFDGSSTFKALKSGFGW
jgi:hypothetical protein